MGDREFQVLRALSFGVAFAIAFLLQRLRPHANRRGSVRTNVGLWAVDGIITGVVCGVRVETIEEPLMRELRYLDKLVDELAKGKAMEKILRTPA